MTKYKFNSQIQLGNILTKSFTQDEVKNEPMLFSCDFKTSIELGGPLTHAFLGSLSQEFFEAPELIVDSRVHMLMHNWYPAIPGMHHDDVPRSPTSGQPDYDNPEYYAKHAMCLVNGDICPTQFALGECELEKVPEGEVIYKKWHNDVMQLLEENKLQSWSAPTNQIIYFDWQTIHQGTAAVSSGFRWFVRASINTCRKPANELRRQTQVYLSNPMAGW